MIFNVESPKSSGMQGLMETMEFKELVTYRALVAQTDDFNERSYLYLAE